MLVRASRISRVAARMSSGAVPELTFDKYPFLKELDLEASNLGGYDGAWFGTGPTLVATNPATGEAIATVRGVTVDEYERCMDAMDSAKARWAELPAPQRGEIVRQMGDALREKIEPLGKLVSLEMGKIKAEGVGEVQEAVDICDYATGLSRMLNGQVIPSERPGHFMMERWNPLKGHVGMITAFNFPVAVAFWNSALSLVAGNCQVWKGAESVPLTQVACTKIMASVLAKHGFEGVATLAAGAGAEVGAKMASDRRIELLSFTGSTEVGREVNATVARRFGKSIMELGGNNAMVVMDDADIEMTVRAAFFSAVGTCGQRCTSLRRLLVHTAVYDDLLEQLKKAYSNVESRMGNPLDEDTLVGPLHNEAAVQKYLAYIERIKATPGARVLCGGKRVERDGFFVEPTIVEIDADADVVQEELFAPVLYVSRIHSLEEGIEVNNSVRQGLSSAIFTKSQENMFRWTGSQGSDCGIVNVNIGTSGAEIGGAFGGEKDTGAGGRESGSDAWKQYCTRQTCTVNYTSELPLAQGITFE
ncbi:MAG: hypothetical protein MHM6MM_006014 [Cercozoa sp. M6MM]